ncbi:MAG: hypothetical protein N2053_11000 [Chitinispirillaceae bacterium]|nr:hypothetical protein [Chitinispirillaceae bacterium]
MHIGYYITAHGYGHALRAATIVNKLPSKINVTFKTTVPISFFKEEIEPKRQFAYESCKIDCGCIQKDSITIDIKETFRQYNAIVKESKNIVEREIKWCKENNVKGIISDIPSIAFEIAKKVGIPSVAVTNFTWYDIYKEYLSAEPLFETILEEMLSQYREATKLLALYPSLPMEYFRNRKELPPIGRRGKIDRGIFKKIYGIPENKKIALIYTGNFGLDANWKKLSEFTDWEFLGLYPLKDAPSNYHLVDKKLTSYADLIASSNCVIGKAGYGVISECMINRTPLIFLARENFAEYTTLEEAIKKWGGGIKIDVKDFLLVNLKDALENVSYLHSYLPLIPDNGVEMCAKEIEEIFV